VENGLCIVKSIIVRLHLLSSFVIRLGFFLSVASLHLPVFGIHSRGCLGFIVANYVLFNWGFFSSFY